MRGYGEMNPPSWVLISGLLKMMDQKFAMKPSLGEAPPEKGKWSKPVTLETLEDSSLYQCCLHANSCRQ